jgi:hypothetical protein
VSSLIPEKESLYRYEILGSSFIALLEPLEKEEDLASLLGAIKDRYPEGQPLLLCRKSVLLRPAATMANRPIAPACPF